MKTSVSDDFKSLEVEMGLRQDGKHTSLKGDRIADSDSGMERLQRSMNAYVKTLSKRNEADDKEKQLPVSFLGSMMVSHGEDFEDDSEFGQCLQGSSTEDGELMETNDVLQVWADQTRELEGYKRRTLLKRHRAGLNHWRGRQCK